MTGYKFKLGEGTLDDVLNHIEGRVEDVVGAVAYALGADLVGLIRNRVAKGLGIDDSPMLSPSKDSMGAYNRDYANYRRDKGRNTDVRDLAMTGRMMSGITIEGPFEKGSEIYVRVFFAGGPDIQIKAAYNNDMTPFFGISPRDQQILDRASQAYLAKFLESEGANGKRSKSKRK